MPRSKELQARREATRRYDERPDEWKAHLDRELAALREQGATTDQILDELGGDLVRAGNFEWLPPATRFICERLDGCTAEDFDERVRDAIDALLATDIPLDPMARRMVSAECRTRGLPDEDAALKELVRQLALESLTKCYTDRGDAAPKKRAANELGLNLGTLKKRRQRSRRGTKNATCPP
jgi:hypothetical protein